ncbi:MAG: alpha/beta hydrolase [Clostridiales bacterium]|nr:alpha/beta hydrolase [Clostridiales bacterium]
MKDLIIYIHGKGGSSQEAEHYKILFPNCDVTGLDYKACTPRDAEKEFSDCFDSVSFGYEKIYLIANSIGAYFALHSLGNKHIEKAFFISPIVNMEKLIADMLVWANTTEEELEIKKEIFTPFGETLSWHYLSWVRNNPIVWNIPTEILYGSRDNLQSIETINNFADRYGANVSVMENGEHWFHTDEQMEFLDESIIQRFL